MNIPIVVIGFNRKDSLKRLLSSVAKARYPGSVDIIISLDNDNDEAVRDVARDFVWDHGKKQLICHPQRLGLRQHILFCGDLVKDFDALIVLEDDLYVSPYFYDYSIAAVSFYHNDEQIAGISLFSHHFSETAYLPFLPLPDQSDVFFMQVPSSWGQIWTASQWLRFRQWYDRKGDNLDAFRGNVPDNVRNWRKSSWKKYFFYYMIDTGTFFVYPRISLTTNFSDPGTHIVEKKSIFQRPLLYAPKNFGFTKPGHSIAVYDAFCEVFPDTIKQFIPELGTYDFEVDLYGSKPLDSIRSAYLFSSKRCRSPLNTYGRSMKPHEANILEKNSGEVFSLGLKTDFKQNRVRKFRSHDLTYYYDLTEYLHFRDVLREIRFRPFKYIMQYWMNLIREHGFRLPWVMVKHLWKRIRGKYN
jgi:hypothetical protein